jgi:hypothetical protein
VTRSEVHGCKLLTERDSTDTLAGRQRGVLRRHHRRWPVQVSNTCIIETPATLSPRDVELLVLRYVHSRSEADILGLWRGTTIVVNPCRHDVEGTPASRSGDSQSWVPR